ncbi:trypsin-like peptidase domain-containing protein [Limobrevibacterium gyesilva]|uniref:Trypsin-like peptidase domain-containing protein n=1 Tax=Limobrevibacterium gyesilva TaxID=2991712 RepID=A0AA42CHU9_9PROT|nr:trypsin-like peptidase domain-containing protein [Limobrevibacterium gyesilva]MCW3475250.1 trypsin-like peptidase domain-containing protein [Limobrevibacterium gyesilva]
MTFARFADMWLPPALAVTVVVAMTFATAAAADAPLPDIVAKLVPSVVNITTWKMMPPSDGQGPPIKTRIFGSGSIVRPDGFIVTARHVVKDGEGFYITLSDGTQLRAQLVVEGQQVDIAVLKVNSGKPLPAVKVGDSDTLRQGDAVIAIGNPLGLSSTVTTGIVSALDRNIQQGPYDAFIQTDAAINPGNSGGGLFNAAGELIGVNDAIFQAADTGGGGSIGLGFAIPVNDAKFAVVHMMEPDWVGPGWIGAAIQQVTPNIQGAVGLQTPDGSILAQIEPGGPAEAAGLKLGDVVTAFNGKAEDNARGLRRAIAVSVPGTTVPVTVWRGGQQMTLQLTLGKTPGFKPALANRAAFAAASDVPALKTTAQIGMTIAPITDALRAQYKLSPDQTGALVTNVAENTDAWMFGVNPGNVIVRVGDQPVTSPEQLRQHVQEAIQQGRQYVMLLFQGPRGFEWVSFPVRQ